MSLVEFEGRTVDLLWMFWGADTGSLSPAIRYLLELINELDEDPTEEEVEMLVTAERCWADTGSC